MSVTPETKEMIITTIDEVFKKMNSISWIDRQKGMEAEAFKNTEKILYCFQTLKEHVASEKKYLSRLEPPKSITDNLELKSASVVRYSKNKAAQEDDDAILSHRKASYERSRNDVKRIEKALQKIKCRKGYEVIEMRYLTRKKHKEGDRTIESLYTYEEIAESLAGKNGYNNNLNEKTVRGYKNTLIKEIAVLLFGSDAI